MRCAIWYHLTNFKKVKNTHRGVLILVKLQADACTFTKINTPPWVFFTFLKLYKWACNFTKINTPPWVFFTFFKLYKWYQIASTHHIWLLVSYQLILSFHDACNFIHFAKSNSKALQCLQCIVFLSWRHKQTPEMINENTTSAVQRLKIALV